MEWFRTHPYSSGVTVIALLFFIGLGLVQQRSAGSVAPDSQSFNTGDVQAYPVANSDQTATNSSAPTPSIGAKNGNYNYISPFGTNPTQTTDTQPTNDSLDALIALVTKNDQPSQNNGSKIDVSGAYAFIPSGLISTTTLSQAGLTADQKGLYDYGNLVGGDIQGFELSHPNQPQTLKEFAEDRTNPDKIAAMKKLGADLSALGDLIAATDPVPIQMKGAQADLAAAYKNIGVKLAQIPDANQTNASLVQAMETYDAAADAFVGKFVYFAQSFPANGVKFSPGDSGSVFVFSNQQAF